MDELLERYGAELSVTDEHRQTMLRIFRDLRNVFVTGGAGTGKTTFVRDVVIPVCAHLGLHVGVTATTGLAGSHMDGKTIHSWAGIQRGPQFPANMGAPQDLAPELVQHIYESTYDAWSADGKYRKHRDGIRSKIRSTEVLILDEVSMLNGVALLGYLDFLFRRVRNDDRPFGGIQMIFVGDFCQLSPVEKATPKYHADWAFLSPAWASADVAPCELTHVFRQADREFANFLNQVRVGLPVDPNYVSQFVRHLTPEAARKASWLVPTNAKADALNDAVLQEYPGPTLVVPAEYVVHEFHTSTYDTRQKVIEQIEKHNSTMRPLLRLRVGLPVMTTANDSEGRYFNGTKAYVHEFKYTDDGLLRAVVVHIPPKTADGEGTLVELSRNYYMRSGSDDPTDVVYVTEAFGEFYVTTKDKRRVRLDDYDPKANLSGQLPAHPFARQFPLIPATAITIHRAQGASLDECVVDLRKTFAPGHVYVGMSRLRTAAGLTITTPNISVQVDPDVMRYYWAMRENTQNTQNGQAIQNSAGA